MIARNLLLIAVAGLSAACIGPAFGDDCNAQRDFEESLAADGVRRVSVDAGAGSLRITGLDGAAQVVARGKACAGSEQRLDEVDLDVTRNGDTIAIKVIIPESNGWSRRNQAWLDLAVTLPSALAVLATDGSGEAEVTNVASLTLDDGSGSLDIEKIAGDVEIEDGSGDIEIRGVGGMIRLEDGSGGLDINNAGAVVVEEDGSGEMRFSDVRGDVRVKRDGSGSIRVRGVGGDFIVERDGSGDIDVAQVAGRVQTPDSDRRA